MDPIVANQFDDAEEELFAQAPEVIRMQKLPQHVEQRDQQQNLPQPSPNASPRDSVSVVSSDTFHEEQARPAVIYANAPPVPAMVGNSSVSDDSSVETITHPPFAIPPGVCKDDVLCGRGKGANNFIGNRRFRELVMQFRDTYSNSSRRADKRVICNQIIDAVRSRGGRFLVKTDHENNENSWKELDHEKILIKVSQALREGVAKWNKATRQYNELKAKKAASVSSAPAMALLAEIASIGFPRP